MRQLAQKYILGYFPLRTKPFLCRKAPGYGIGS